MADNFKDLSEKYKQQLMNTYGKRSADKQVSKADKSFFLSDNTVASADIEVSDNTSAADNQAADNVSPNNLKNSLSDTNAERNTSERFTEKLYPSEPIFEEEKEPLEESTVTDYSEFLKKHDISPIPPVSERFPKPNLPEFIKQSTNECIGMGFLKVRVSAAESAVPIENALVVITQGDNILYSLITDSNGDTPVVEISTPCSELDVPQSEFATVDIGIYYRNFYSEIIKGAAIFDNIKSLQNVNLIPLPLYFAPETIIRNSAEPIF